jgi:hypothetical protein
LSAEGRPGAAGKLERRKGEDPVAVRKLERLRGDPVAVRKLEGREEKRKV